MLPLEALKAMVENAADLTADARAESERARDYYDGHQWTAEEIAALKKRKQPVVTINRIQRKVDGLIGYEQRQRVDPKAFPRNPQDEQSAEMATKALVFVDDNTRFDVKRSAVFENIAIEGYGGVEITVEQVRGKLEIAVNRLRWEEIFFDPYSRERDFSDATYMGSQKWMTLDTALATLAPFWEGKSEELEALLETSLVNYQQGETYEDRPRKEEAFRWGDKKHRRVRVAQMYYQRGGTWHLAVFVSGGEVYHKVSPYHDEDGEPCCPIELAAAYVDRENRRYGVVKAMLSPQDEVNKRRSKLLHGLNSRQTIGVKGAVDSVAAMKAQLASPDGHVEINHEQFLDAAQAGMRPFELIPQTDQIAGQFSLLQESKGEIDQFGPNPSLMGQVETGASGRAILAQQQAGMAEMAPLYDTLRDWTLRCYRQMWARIKQFWTEERWIRVTDADGKPEWAGFNVPTGGMMQVIDMQTQQPVIRPQLQNVVAEIDIDIIIEQVPDQVTLQAEMFEQLVRLAEMGIPIPPEVIVRASSVMGKTEILKALGEAQQQAAQMAAAKEAAVMEMEGQKVEAKVARDRAGAQRDAATAQKTVIEAMQMAQGLR